MTAMSAAVDDLNASGTEDHAAIAAEVQWLSKLLGDPSVAQQASVALRQMKPIPVRFLTAQLCDPDSRTRRFAEEYMRFLGCHDSKDIAATLRRQGGYHEDELQALEFMGGLSWDGLARRLLHGPPLTRAYACFALGKFGDESLPYLDLIVSRLEDADGQVQAFARQTLVELGEQGLQALTGRLLEEDVQARAQAVEALRGCGREGARAVAKLLLEAKPATRLRAMEVLQTLEDGALECAEILATWEDCAARRNAAMAFAAMGEWSATHSRQMAELLQDRDPWVRASAARALAAGGRVTVLMHADQLAHALTDEVELVRLGAAKALATAGEDASPWAEILAKPMDDQDLSIRQAARDALEAMGDAGRPVLARASQTDKDRCGAKKCPSHEYSGKPRPPGETSTSYLWA